MKYLKTYEYSSNFKFDLGDKVICVIDSWPVEKLVKGNEYVIYERKDFAGKNFYSILNNGILVSKHDGRPYFFGEKVFITPLEYDSNKYNL